MTEASACMCVPMAKLYS